MQIARSFEVLTSFSSLCYQGFGLYCVSRFRQPLSVDAGAPPPISVLKPIRGMDAQLYANLASFCEQDYPRFQVVFAVADRDDAAIPIVRQLIERYPQADLALVVDDRKIGVNCKISNVANAAESAKYDILVVADSDMRVRRDYLQRIAAAFNGENVGAVTCLYTGTAMGRLVSRLASMYINESFLPSVLVALRMETLKFCFGATMAVRREALRAIGGWSRIGEYLADDYMLGKLVSEHGYRVAMASCVVENIVGEESMGAMLRHELRWARTVRTVRPTGYTMSLVTQSIPLTGMMAALLHGMSLGIAMFATAVALRVAQHYAVRNRFEVPGRASPWLVPVRDVLNVGVWAVSFFGNNVHWRGRTFAVARDGSMVQKEA